MEQLQQWLEEKCNEQNLSWREASIKADLNPGAISAIMGGQVAGLESCKALAKLFRVSPVFVLRLAGHLEDPANSPNLSELLLDPHFRYFASMWSLLPDYARELFARQVKVMTYLNPDLRAAMREAGMEVPEPPEE
jgi:hypothetical protein